MVASGRTPRRASAGWWSPGLAKGGHQDRDDFYKRIEREESSGDPALWLPTSRDERLLKQETAARIRTEWELAVQRAVLEALRVVHAGGTHRIEVSHPVPGRSHFASVDLTVAAVREDGYEADEIELEVIPERRYAGSALLWQLSVRALISVSPPEQGWDRFGNTYSNIGEPGLGPRELTISTPSLSHAWRYRNQGRPVTTPTDAPAGRSIGEQCARFVALTSCHAGHDSLPACPTCRTGWPSSPTDGRVSRSRVPRRARGRLGRRPPPRPSAGTSAARHRWFPPT